MAQGELRAGHQGGFTELLIQRVRGVVEGAPAFLVRPAPERGVRVQPLQIIHRDTDLAHGTPRVGHDFTEHLLEDVVDDGVEELRMLEPVAGANFGEIIEPHGQAELARLHLFPAQLAGEPRGFAQHKGQRGFVIMFVLRQGGAAGDGGAILDLQHEGFVPLAIREQPQLLAPDAEFLFQQHRGQFRDVAEGKGHEGSEGSLAVGANTRHLRHGPVFQEGFFLAGRHFEKAGALGGIGGEFGELGGVAEAGGHGEARLFQYALADALDVVGGGGVAPDVFVHAGKIQKALVDGIGHEGGRVFLQDQEHLAGQLAVGVIVRFAEDAVGAKALGLEAGGAGLDAVFFGEAVGGDDDAVAAPAAANPDGPAFQPGIERDLATGEEGISVDVQDAIVFRHGFHRSTRLSPRRGPSLRKAPGQSVCISRQWRTSAMPTRGSFYTPPKYPPVARCKHGDPTSRRPALGRL